MNDTKTLRDNLRTTFIRFAVGALLANNWCVASNPLHAQDSDVKQVFREYANSHPGNAVDGERLFRESEKLLCGDCHRITGVEKAGPNLDGVADKFSKADLIRHVLDPSATIKPGFEQVSVVSVSGQVFTGRLVRATKEMLRIMDAKSKTRDILRVDIDQSKESPVSLMPDNVVASASPQEFCDLISYLESLHYQLGSGLIGTDQPIDIPQLAKPVTFRPLNSEQTFANPVWCGAIPGLAGELAVVEHQEARIWRVRSTDNGRIAKELFLDLSDEVKYGNNWGLMCVAFHPNFASNQRYFIEHETEESGTVKTVIVERRATVDLRQDADVASRRYIELEQPAFNHNGGCIGFGPDGMLYAAYGDGGPQRDPNGFCQNPRILHGSMIRIDVDHSEGDRPYTIPTDNPFLDAHKRDPKIRPETWAIGFREPWRFSFDPTTGDLWVGDVGQDKYEEIAVVKRGENHGWNVLEGYEPFSDQYRQPQAAFTDPLFAYHHSIGVSVTGGFVYRGSKHTSFDGVYLFGDYETRRVWGLTQSGNQVVKIRELGECPEHIASFGVDHEGEILIVGYEGTVFRVDLSGTTFE